MRAPSAIIADRERIMTIKRILITLVAAAILFAARAVEATRAAEGHLKPEIRDAVKVTRAMLAPMRFAKQKVWYSALLEDPRYGKYKAGYMFIEFDKDKDGNLILRQESDIRQVLYSVKMSREFVKYEEVIDRQTGLPLRASFEYDVSGRTYWLISIKLPPESRMATKKTAIFDWTSNKIKMTYGDGPNAHVRMFPLERDSVPAFAPVIFMFRLMGRQEEKVYSFRYFDMQRERYEDSYLQFEGPRAKGIQKYSTVPQGWGDQTVTSFWFGPPSEEAPNGRFEKYIINPLITRYITFLPTTKEKALEPVTPLID